METPVDNVLSLWKSYLTNISSNLMELSDQTEFQLIKAKVLDKKGGYTGITKVKAEECVETLGILWRYFSLLSEVMDKAVSIYDKRIFEYKAEEEVTELFEKTLIVIDSERVDINDRNLLGSQVREEKDTPKNLLKHMQEAFEKLCKDVNEISQAEEGVHARLINIKVEIEKLNSTVKGLGISKIPVFDTDKIAKIENDPLQGLMELDKLVYSIEKYRATILRIQEEYNEVSLRLDKVNDMLFELSELSAKSKVAVSESQKIFGTFMKLKPIIGEEVLKSLKDWFQVLKNKLSEGSISAVKIGVSKLEEECSLKLELERENYNVNSRDYNEWLDLKGQFKALLVKAEVLKSKGLLMENTLEQIIRDTREVLYAEPVNLDSCRKMVGKLLLNL